MKDLTLKALKKIAKNEAACEIIKHHTADVNPETETWAGSHLYQVVYMALTMAGAPDADTEASIVITYLREATYWNLDAQTWFKIATKIV